MLLMLEDDSERLSRFTKSLAMIDPSLRLVIWRSARRMVREVEPYLASARLISLDHDLEPQQGDLEDPGDGIEVARFLAERAPVCPVIVHSSNGTRADWMIGEFELGGWDFRRVAPIGEDWIEAYWLAVVEELLGRSRRPRRGQSRARSQGSEPKRTPGKDSSTEPDQD